MFTRQNFRLFVIDCKAQTLTQGMILPCVCFESAYQTGRDYIVAFGKLFQPQAISLAYRVTSKSKFAEFAPDLQALADKINKKLAQIAQIPAEKVAALIAKLQGAAVESGSIRIGEKAETIASKLQVGKSYAMDLQALVTGRIYEWEQSEFDH